MPRFAARIADGWQRALRNLPLALIPMLFALLDTNNIASVLSFDGVHVGFRVGAPVSVVTIWQFVSVPNSGVTVSTGIPLEALPLAVVTVPVLLVVQAGLSAGYFGSIADRRESGEYDFVGNVAAQLVPFLVLTAVPVLLVLPLALGAFGLGAATGSVPAVGLVFVVALVGFVVAAYLFYATPSLVVLRDAGGRRGGARVVRTRRRGRRVPRVLPRVRAVRPRRLAGRERRRGERPGRWIPAGVVGGVLGLAANVATMRFVADVDPASPSLGTWAEGDGGEMDDGTDGEDDGPDGDGTDGGDGTEEASDPTPNNM